MGAVTHSSFVRWFFSIQHPDNPLWVINYGEGFDSLGAADNWGSVEASVLDFGCAFCVCIFRNEILKTEHCNFKYHIWPFSHAEKQHFIFVKIAIFVNFVDSDNIGEINTLKMQQLRFNCNNY